MKNEKLKKREWHKRHTEFSFVRKLASKKKRKTKNRVISGSKSRVSSSDFLEEKDRVQIDCAERLDLSTGIEDTLNVVQNIRSGRMKSPSTKFHIAIEKIDHISPGAALLMASALDRRKILSQNRARYSAVTANDWSPNVVKLLRQIGFLSLLGVRNIDVEPIESADIGVDFLPMQRGIQAEGKKARKLRKQLSSLAGFVTSPPKLFGAVTEAMTNTRHHAYVNSSSVNYWWMSASYDHVNRWMTVMFVDHGLGIPKTLPVLHKNYFASIFANITGDRGMRDAKIIDAAMELGRSSESGPTRGKGLKKNVQGFIEQNRCKGKLRIISRKGLYIFEKDQSGKERVTLKSLRTEFLGTLIEWSFEVNPSER